MHAFNNKTQIFLWSPGEDAFLILGFNTSFICLQGCSACLQGYQTNILLECEQIAAAAPITPAAPVTATPVSSSPNITTI